MATIRSQLSRVKGVPFAKMTGSGNDFVFFDGRTTDRSLLTSPEVIQAICNRHNGIGADGIVILEAAPDVNSHVSSRESDRARIDATIHYYNSDGTPADLCGNATLCSTTMSVELGMAQARDVRLSTPAGHIASRLIQDEAEIDLQPVRDIRPEVSIDLVAGERRLGFAIAGIPHVVVLCDDADAVDVVVRGPQLRWNPSVGAPGANVNWVSPRSDGRWRYRTFERGVEGETLACGTGAVATAVLLSTWGLAQSPVVIRTSSGRDLTVALSINEGVWTPTLRGEGRVVFRGQIGDLGA